MISLFKMLMFNVVLARPTESASSKETDTNEDTEEDSGSSSAEECGTNNVSTKKVDSKYIHVENASNTDQYSSMLKGLDISNEDSHLSKYDSPRPPEADEFAQCDSKRHECVDKPNEQAFTLSLDRHPSEFNSYINSQWMPVSRGLTPYPTLSTDDLTLDARACALPRRRKKTTAKTKVDESKDYGNTKDKAKEDNTETTEGGVREQDSIEDFIKGLVATQIPSKPNVLFFDAAIVYEKEDYIEALNFKEETLMIVKSEYNEEIRIELFDSEAFAQSKVCVVQDVIDKCSMIFVYLTNNFRSPELKYFVEEAIGICRLQLGNMSYGPVHNNSQWLVKPVHTASPKMRAYKVPSGLLTISGIDWYDKHTEHTQQKIRAVVRTAYNARKQRELESYISDHSHMRLHMNDKVPISQTRPVTTRPTSAKVASTARNMSNKKREHINSNASVDAMSFIGNVPQYDFVRSQQNTYSTGENFSRPVLPTSPMSDDHHRLPHDRVPSQYLSTSYPYGPIYPEQNAHRSLPANTMTQNRGQTGQYPQMLPQANQYFQPLGYHQINAQNGYIVQSASMHDQFPQPPRQGDVFNYSNAPVYPGYANTQTINRRMDAPQTGYHGHLRSGQNQPPNLTGIQYSPEIYPATPHNNQYTNTGMHINMQGNSSNFQLPLRQQGISAQQANGYYQNQPLSRDAYPSEQGNFLRDQRNDALPPTQLSVVSQVTGNLIVNPNLSTDDVEVDYGSIKHAGHAKQGSKYGRTKHKRSSKRYESTDSEESSSDSDCDIRKQRTQNRVKRKVVNIVGSKIVQIGRSNKVIESSNSCSDDFENPHLLETKYEQVGTKSRTDYTGNSLSKVNEGSFVQQVSSDMQSPSNCNILSTDNMSLDSSLDTLNINKDFRVKEKFMIDKVILPAKASIKDDKQLEGRCIELMNMNVIDTKHSNNADLNIKSNDRYSRGYSEKFSSIRYHGSREVDLSPDPIEGRFNENEDNLFESGSYNNEHTVAEATFMFSNARKERAGLLKGGSLFLKSSSQDIHVANTENEID